MTEPIATKLKFPDKAQLEKHFLKLFPFINREQLQGAVSIISVFIEKGKIDGLVDFNEKLTDKDIFYEMLRLLSGGLKGL
jgi:hypothetical protein